MRTTLSIVLGFSIALSGFAPAFAGNNPQRLVNNAVNSVLDANENRNDACWNRSASSCRSASAEVAENCQHYLYVREDVQSANIFWPDSTPQADYICRDPFGSGEFPTETVRRHGNMRPHYGGNTFREDRVEILLKFLEKGAEAIDRAQRRPRPAEERSSHRRYICGGNVTTNCLVGRVN